MAEKRKNCIVIVLPNYLTESLKKVCNCMTSAIKRESTPRDGKTYI